MKVASEIYKGIEFVRVATLPQNQKEKFWQSFDTEKIIKILTNDSLLNDCIQYCDYSEWFAKNFTLETPLTEPSLSISNQVLQVA